MYGWAWLLVIAALIGMFPWARWALRRESDRLLTALLTLGLSFGALSLSAFWIGWLGGSIRWPLTTLVYVIICALGWIIWWRSHHQKSQNPPGDRLQINWLVRIALIAIGIMAGLILFNALYWPISTDDAVAIYGIYGKQIAMTAQLPVLHPGVLYETYPMALPLIEAYVFQAAGWYDSHLAALAPALLSIGTLGVAYLIGRTLVNRTVGIAAAFLIATSPLIAYWSSTSYVDLPAGFFYGLAWLFVIRYSRDRQIRDAILCGIMAGLSAWTKNSGLLIVGSLGLWALWLNIIAPERSTSHSSPLSASTEGESIPRLTTAHKVNAIIKDGLLIGVPFLIVCGPWYARNLILAGWIIPPTGWTYLAQRTVNNLFPYLIDRRYLPGGVAFTLGLIWMIWQVIRSRGRAFTPTILLIGYLPFFIIWWLLFSYENRFLLVLTPLIGVMGGIVIHAILQRIRLPAGSVRRWIIVGSSALILLSALPAAAAGVLFKNELIRQPFMGEVDKQQIRFGGRYQIGMYLQSHPDGCTLTTDTLLAYLAYPAPMIVGNFPRSADQMAGCHYWMLTPTQSLPDWAKADPLIMTAGNYRLYAMP